MYHVLLLLHRFMTKEEKDSGEIEEILRWSLKEQVKILEAIKIQMEKNIEYLTGLLKAGEEYEEEETFCNFM